MEQTFEIVVDQLMADEEFRQSFFESPYQALRNRDEWGLPLCDSEALSLLAMPPSGWDRLTEALNTRLHQADAVRRRRN